MRFLHTADWQIGMKAAHAGAAGELVRRARLDSAKRVVAAARERGAEFILAAGDTFEHNAVPRADVQRVADMLGAFPGPVFVIPGNHDPLVPGSVWEFGAWAGHENIRILGEAVPVEIPGGLLFPCPATSRHSLADPTAWIPSRSGEEIRIGLAHGTLALPHIDEHGFPIPLDAAVTRGLDYLALGHWHSTLITEDGRTAYSGTHETTRFGERDSGNVLLVTVEAGARPDLETIDTGGLRWLEPGGGREIRSLEDLVDLAEECRKLPEPGETLLRIHLRGVMPPGATEVLDDLDALLDARFPFVDMDRDGLAPSPADSGWVDALPGDSVAAAVARRLLAMADSTGDRAGTQPAAAAEALQLLFRLARQEER